MTHISVHDTKQKWESNHGKDSRVDFFVHRNTIGINDLLEWHSKLVSLDMSGWLDGVVLVPLEVSCRVLSQHVPDLWLVLVGTPEVSNVSCLSLSHVVK